MELEYAVPLYFASGFQLEWNPQLRFTPSKEGAEFLPKRRRQVAEDGLVVLYIREERMRPIAGTENRRNLHVLSKAFHVPSLDTGGIQF
ncbi:MAG: hypothetical protein JRN59_05265 [Nitrososphaerota archaeon]|nr:hypothetical protein [Nitrososphaerota archaeon]